MTTTPLPAALPADQETAHTRLMAHVEAHEEDGLRIPCRGPEAALWTTETHAATRAAVQACQDCPALTACHDYATTHQEAAGVWGGTTPTSRTKARSSHTRRQNLMETRKAA